MNWDQNGKKSRQDERNWGSLSSHQNEESLNIIKIFMFYMIKSQQKVCGKLTFY